MGRTTNVLLCGVGGQGILLASEITAAALITAGFDVKKSEVHGMAQRGGSVVAHLRYGDQVYSPLIDPGAADVMVAFELLESLRYFPYLHRDSAAIVNTQRILPAPVSTGVEAYPADVLDQLGSRLRSVFPIDAFGISTALGEVRAVNMVLVGALSVFLDVGEDVFLTVIRERIPEKIRRLNTEAFLKGREVINTLQEVQERI